VNRSRLFSASSVAIAAFLWIGTANAAIFQFEAVLDGLQQVPPNATPGSGLVTVELDDSTDMVTITSGTYQDLLANAIASHIHGLAGPGVNAAVLVPLTVSGGTAGTITGNGVITAAQALGMEQGLTYVNVHTQVFPGGEIRGQLLPIPEPGSVVLLAVGTLGLLIAAWHHRRRTK
jgi:hypothetical protein